MAAKKQVYQENGVIVSKTTIYVGDEITLTYSGLLADSGADKVYAYVGYGEEWDKKGFVPMNYELDTFKATFKVLEQGTLNIAFKDSANNWDNNSSENYTFKVSKKQKSDIAACESIAEVETEKKRVTKKASTKEKIEEAVPKKKTVRKKKEE